MRSSSAVEAPLILCRRHHGAKQVPGWRLEQPEPGLLTWTLPSRRRSTVAPEPYPAQSIPAPKIRPGRLAQVSRTIWSAGDRWSTISPVATNVRVTRAELYTQRIFMGVSPVLRKAWSVPAAI
jgi:hypothetical protein